jgi:hypothetical protein
MIDDTESVRRDMLATGQPQADLAATTGERWDHEQVRDAFEIIGFMAPFAVAIRKSTGKKGTLMFTHHPRFYFSWQED